MVSFGLDTKNTREATPKVSGRLSLRKGSRSYEWKDEIRKHLPVFTAHATQNIKSKLCDPTIVRSSELAATGKASGIKITILTSH